jgi:hypothetical protein
MTGAYENERGREPSGREAYDQDGYDRDGSGRDRYDRYDRDGYDRDRPGRDGYQRDGSGRDAPRRAYAGQDTPRREPSGEERYRRETPDRDVPGRDKVGRDTVGRDAPGREVSGRDRADRENPRQESSAQSSGRPLLREISPPYRRRSGEIAAVLLYRNGGHRVVWPDRTEDSGKPFLGSPYTVFEVRLGRNVTGFALRLPAAGDGAFFDARVRVRWTVEDPYLVVREQVRDVAELLHDELFDGLRSLSRRFRLTEAQRAEEAVRETLATGRLVVGRDIGLRAQVYVFVDLDEKVQEEVARADRVDVTLTADVREAQAALHREEWERRRVAAEAAALEEMFRRGDLAQLAHHMARNPDKEMEIRAQLLQEKREGQAELLAVFNRMLDSGVLERHEVDEQAYQILQHLRGSAGAVLGGVAERVLDTGRRAGRPALERAVPEPAAPLWDDEPEPEREPASEPEFAFEPESEPEFASEPGFEPEPDASTDRRVYEPTRVQASFERDDAESDRGGRRARPSADFDDWDDA